MADQWDARPAGPGVVARLLVPSAGAKPATLAFALAVVAAAAFVTSLVLDWQRVTLTLPTGEGGLGYNGGSNFVITARPGTLSSLSEVYALGMVGLLGLIGTVLTRPDLALRFRLGATGVGVGLLGVVAAILTGFAEESVESFGGVFGAVHDQLVNQAKVAYGPGAAAAVVAVAVAVAAIWLAARPAARALARPPATPAEPSATGTSLAVDELTVSPSQPVELGTDRDPWSR